jgi:hypothetical protein
MTLPPKALNVLIDYKKELLSREVILVPEPPKKEEKTSQRMRGARNRGQAWQGFYRRGRRW